MPEVEDTSAALAELPKWLGAITGAKDHLGIPTTREQLKHALTALNTKVEECIVTANRAVLLKLVHEVRKSGALESLALLLEDKAREIHRPVILLLGNLASDKVDPAALTSRKRLRSSGILEKLFPYFESLDVIEMQKRIQSAEAACEAAAKARQRAESEMQESKSDKYAYLTACEKLLEHDGLVAKAAQHLTTLKAELEYRIQTVVFLLGVIINFVADVKEPMLNASSPLRNRYAPMLETLSKDADPQLSRFATHALAQLSTGVALRDRYYATKLQARARAWLSRADATIRRRRKATADLLDDLVMVVALELASPLIPAALMFGRELNQAATTIQGQMRIKLAKRRAHTRQRRRLELWDASDWICEELLDFVADGFVEPMAAWHVRETRLPQSLPAAAAEAAMRAVAEAEEMEAARREARERAKHEAAEREAEARAAEAREEQRQRALAMRAREREMEERQALAKQAVAVRQASSAARQGANGAPDAHTPPRPTGMQPGLGVSRSATQLGETRRQRRSPDKANPHSPAHASPAADHAGASSMPKLPAISPQQSALTRTGGLQPRTLMLARVERSARASGGRNVQQLQLLSPAISTMLESEHFVFRHGRTDVVIGSPGRLRMMGCDVDVDDDDFDE